MHLSFFSLVFLYTAIVPETEKINPYLLILSEEKEELASMFIPASALKGSGTLVFSEAYLQSTLFVTKGRIENAEKKQKGKRSTFLDKILADINAKISNFVRRKCTPDQNIISGGAEVVGTLRTPFFWGPLW